MPVLILVLTLLCGVFSSCPASAQEAVKLRTGQHDDYSRLVFEWPEKPQYSISKEGNRVTIRFAKAGTTDTSAVDTSGNVKKVETISTGTEPLQMAVTIPDGSRFRDFTVGNKLILDVYNAAGTPKAQTEPKPETPKVALEEKPAEVEKPKGDFSVLPAEKAAPVPVGKVDSASVAAPILGDHTITLTSTAGFGVASFVRAGFLWIIVDNAELGVKPIIVGPQKDRLGEFTQETIDGGTAFRIALPDGLLPHAEGGGVGWKIILSAKSGTDKPAEMSRDDGSLVWKLALMKKQIKVPDPMVGDTINVITAVHSDQFAGTARSFVELNQLDSVVGLAFVPKADDVKAEIQPDKVIVGKPGGLSLFVAASTDATAKKEIAPEEKEGEHATAEEPKKESEETAEHAETASHEDAAPHAEEHAAAELPPIEDLQKVAAAKPAGNNIYNFPRWEMGGIGALNNNMRLIMLDDAGHKEADRVASIITMAKLNIANNRAPEALGLLRIAEQFVPELDGNSEFQALRGAASALAGKYDVAFSDFTNNDLAKYTDIPYWRSYTLAGLEDWKQAIETLPTKFDEIATYPAIIRTPMALTFAEIALRGGKVPLAENILSMITPDAKKLPMQYLSALNYLNGEAARQKGNAAKAEQYWKPLTTGKDYLYRAKAGLSLTKLDQKKLKPAEAIDRLEGLRYAWRGDELEALINFRLGQMYIENKDYLKGLTILRNAASLATVRDLSQEIDTFMRKAFRDVFTKDQLKIMSPLEAISFYEEFKDLAPQGEEGNQFVETLAERLVNADLLGRAAALLEFQVNNKLTGDKKAEIAIRLAAIRLLDGNPDGALRSLEIAQIALNGVEPAAGKDEAETVKKEGDTKTPDAAKTEEPEAKDATPQPATPLTTDSEKQRQIDLLKARALSMKKKTDEAMAILERMRLDPDVNRLRTDIAWGAGKWEQAAEALNDLIITEQISPRLPLTEYQTGIILNRAIALNLAGNRVALANLRDRYNAQMEKTTKGQLFEVVTRPRRPDMIGSREAIESMISELSLFQGFLDSYAKVNGDKAADAAVAPVAKTTVPDTGAPPMAPATSTPAHEKDPVSEPVPADKQTAE